jgi:hypothetical protein
MECCLYCSRLFLLAASPLLTNTGLAGGFTSATHNHHFNHPYETPDVPAANGYAIKYCTAMQFGAEEMKAADSANFDSRIRGTPAG